MLMPVKAPAAGLSVAPSESAESLAFARYMASIQERDPFTETGPAAVEIEASLPRLYIETRLLAVRAIGESERSEYHVLQIEGDAIVAQEVIAHYFAVEEQMEALPASSIAITPANYKFHYKGEVGDRGGLAYVYQITPRKKRHGLIEGQLWIDSITGAAILQEGRFVKTPPPFTGKMEVVRNTELWDGCPSARVTHVTIDTRLAGRGELTITEIPLQAPEEEHPPMFKQNSLGPALLR